MANNGPKFVSVNLNKSYGQPHHYPHYNGGQGSGAGRGRSVVGGSGGMVVLSRNRGMAPKVVPKLSVPPPMNLPSRKMQSEKYDMLGPGGSGGGGGNIGGSRPTSSGVGWTKLTAVAATMTESAIGIDTPGARAVDVGAGSISGSYMPPSARTGAMPSVMQDGPLSANKSLVLRGEDFPTLQAARPVSSGAGQKLVDGNQKQKNAENEDLKSGRKGSYDEQQSGMTSISKGKSHVMDNHNGPNLKNGDYLPDPLPLVRMTPRSDWADDERDTGHGFVEHEREAGFPKGENYWDRDFDFPRPSFPPYKPILRQSERHGRDSESGISHSSDMRKINAYNKDVSGVNQGRTESEKWGKAPLARDSFQESENGFDYRKRMTVPGNIVKENKYIPPHLGDTSRDNKNTGNQESFFGRRDLSTAGRQQPINSVESFNNHRIERFRHDEHLSEQNARFRGDNFQSNAFSKTSVGFNSKMGHPADPTMAIDRDKRFSRSEQPIMEAKPSLRDISSSVFDEKDLFSGSIVGIIKRKKDAAKITNIHDPVRESFEAEIELIQKKQELDRQMLIEQQERALEQAQREKEEKEKRIQEEKEQLQRMEEEAREAARRAEQEQLEAIRRAEEQRIAKEEEKRKIQMEEERRKQAAKQKLLEVEARMARRQADAVKDGASAPNKLVYEKVDAGLNEHFTSRNSGSDRVVENARTAVSFGSPPNNRPEMNLRQYPHRDEPSNFHEKGKASSSWRRDLTENDGIFSSPFPNLETGNSNPRYDMRSGRPAPRKELSGGTQYAPNRDLLRVGENESSYDDFGYNKDHRWNFSGYSDSYGKLKLADSELHDDMAEKYGDNGWGLRSPRGYTRPLYKDRTYPNTEPNDVYFSGRSRYSLRQPRVLPPPTHAPAQRTTSVTENAEPVPFMDSGIHRTERGAERAFKDHSHQILEPSDIFTSGVQKLEIESGCDSQSSLSVSSPPASAPHLSHDELDESEDLYVLSSSENERNLLRRNDSAICNSGTVMTPEDEEWSRLQDYTLQQQEEYDEDEDGHRENEVHDENENTEIQKFGLAHEERELAEIQNNVVLGFDEGVEVEIPNDDFENIGETQERLVGMPGSSFGFSDERGPLNVLPSEETNRLTAGDSYKRSTAISSGMVAENYVLESSSATNHVHSRGSLDASIFSMKERAAPSVDVAISPTPNISSLTHTETQSDLPVKLQFGLFSGTSIPSPMPAIQIGSIQMPLHTHSSAVSSVNQMYLSQPALFKFGQIHHSSSSKDGGVFTTHQSGQHAPLHKVNRDLEPSFSLANQQGFASTSTAKANSDRHHHNSHTAGPGDKKNSGTASRAEDVVEPNSALKSILPSTSEKASESQFTDKQTAFAGHKFVDMRRHRQVPGGRGRRFAYAIKNEHTMASALGYNIPADRNELQRRPRRTVQRREYRIREKDEKKPTESLNHSDGSLLDDKTKNMEKSNWNFASSGSKRSSTISKRTLRQKTLAWSSGGVAAEKLNSGDVAAKESEKDSSTRIQTAHKSGEVHLRQNASDDVDAPLLSGVVRVFNQLGIECPSDEDDFIEVRSKRQMLNDRREQKEKEKEIKAKSFSTKTTRKSHAFRQKAGIVKIQKESPAQSRDYAKLVTSPSVAETVAAPQPLTAKSHVNSETKSMPSHVSPVAIFSNGGSEIDRVGMSENKNMVTSLDQSQIDEPIKPARHSSHISAFGGQASAASDTRLEVSVSSVVDNAYSGASSISSALIGEKIQFGAVMSPVVLPPGLSQGDVIISQKFPVTMNEGSLFYEKDEHLSHTHASLQVSEAEGAIAIGNGAISSNKMSKIDQTSANDTKSFGVPINSHTRSGVVGDQKSTSQSRTDEFSVSLPEDLSVETTPISLWPQLPSPQSSFTSSSHSHFPFYDMNQLLGSPNFAMSHGEEPSGAQKLQNTSGPLANWHHHHSGVDSFYGHSGGYSGPFVGPSGSIPGVQGPRPMVVYNHFAHVGQYGSMGAGAFIPSGKQADWNPTTSSGEVDVNNMNTANMQRTAAGMPPVFLPPAFQRMPMPSTLPVFEKSPFQTSDLPVYANLAPLHSAPISRPAQPQDGAALHLQGNHDHAIDKSVTTNRLTEPRIPTSDATSGFSSVEDVNVSMFSAVGGALDESLGVTASPLVPNIGLQNSSISADADSLKTNRNESDKKQGTTAKTRQYLQRNPPQQHGNASGYNYRRGGMTQRNNQGNDWSQRHVGFRGRNSSAGGEKGFPSPAVKARQIYVAKQTSNLSSTT